MKTIIQSLAFVLAATFARAQEAPAEMVAMLDKTFNEFDSTSTTMNYAAMVPISAKLDIIAETYPDQWIAQYYAGYAKVQLSYFEPDVKKKDLLVDQAVTYLEAVEAMKVTNEERYILAALVANGRLAVDGEKRWKEYGKIFEENLEKAKKINADNPHIYYLKGTSIFFTPKMFGGGAKNALPYFEKAEGLFAKMDKNILIPYWGGAANTYFIGECKK